MASDYIVEPMDRSQFSELTPLMKDAFGDDVDTQFFEWKYWENPSGPAVGNIARHRDSGQIAAFYGMIPEAYRWGSDRRRIYQSCDTMTHSLHRRKGLFQLLAKATYATAQAADPAFCAFGFGGPTSTPGFLKMGWRIAFGIPYLFRPFPLTMLPALRGAKASVRRLDKADDALIAMICKRSAARANSIDMTEASVRWRLKNPLRTYQLWVDDDGAYAIAYRSANMVLLLDFWEESRGRGRNVWNAVRAESLSPRTKGILTFAQPGTDFDIASRSHGLFRNPFSRGPAAGTIPFITFGDCPNTGPGSWSITPLDHDSY